MESVMRIENDTPTAEILAEFGARVREARVAARLTQAQLARRADVSTGTVASIESGAGATMGKAVAVLRVLGLAGNFDLLAPAPSGRLRDGGASGRAHVRVRQGKGEG